MTQWRIVAAIGMAGLTVVAALPGGQAQRVETTIDGMHLSTLPGFVVERLNPGRPDSYVAMTFDAVGRPVVAKEFDHPRRLVDADGDGLYESERLVTDRVHSCQGLWFDGPTLYATCMPSATNEEMAAEFARIQALLAKQTPVQGSTARLWHHMAQAIAGLWRIETNAEGEAVSVERLMPLLGTVEEHGPHALRRGPDGELWYVAGNNHGSALNEDLDDAGSLVLGDTDAQLLPAWENFGPCQRAGVCSALHRVNREARTLTVLMGGNRNVYDFSFNDIGEVFWHDSDHEPEMGTPWFRWTRSVHGIPGGNYGYRTGSGKYPEWYLDSLPPMRDLHRGSPVGVETYLSYAFPPEYYDNLFEGDWSRGRLLYTHLTPDGATYATRDDQAEFLHGIPLNITDLEVGPDGSLYFTTGGRATRGGFWRIRYTGPPPPQPDRSGILAVVRQPQPLSSWGWAAIERVKAAMGEAAFGAALEQVARDTSMAPRDRVRAVYEMQRHGPSPSAALLRTLIRDAHADIRAAAVYAAGQASGDHGAAVAATGLNDANALVRRRSLEAVVRLGQAPGRPSIVPAEDIYRQLNDEDRFVRWAARVALERTPRSAWATRVLDETNPTGIMEGLLAWVRTAGGESLEPALRKQFALMRQPGLSVDDKLRLSRLFHYTATALPEGGLDATRRMEAFAIWSGQFPSGDDRLDREIALTLAYSQHPEAAATILGAMPEGEQKPLVQLHYLYALRTIGTGWTPARLQQAGAVFERASRWRGGVFNPLMTMFEELTERLPESSRAELFAAAPSLAPPPVVASGEGAGRGGRRGGRGGRGPGLEKQEAFERLVYVPDQTGFLRGAGPRMAYEDGVVVGPTSGHLKAAAAPVVDMAQARESFAAACGSCHRYGAVGTTYGPDLTGHTLTRRQIAEAMFYPDRPREIGARFRTTVVETVDGRTLRGIVVTDDPQRLVLKTADTPEPVSLAASEIRERRQGAGTIMPDFFERTPRIDFAGILAFLAAPAPEQ